MRELSSASEIYHKIDIFSNHATNCTLIIDGKTLSTIMNDEPLKLRFFEQAMRAPCVCICRCSPTQKADVTRLMRTLTGGKRVAGIGDGGNDVGMILEADCGIGIEGKEGMQASLAADFSLKEFGQLKKLILWHGRLSYRRSAVLAQFVFHRGLIISILQAFFTVMFYFVAIPIYNGYLMLGYSTIYTNLPIFSLVFDEDADVDSVLQFPPLYKSLQKGRSLSLKTFSVWLWKSVYQVSQNAPITCIRVRRSFCSQSCSSETALRTS
jgi:phospholipid-translocating ATPase